MNLIAILAVLASTALAFQGLPPRIVSRANNTALETGCFDLNPPKLTCYGHQAPYADALGAVQSVCAKRATCVPGTSYPAVTSKIPQYTATLTLGTQCGGVTDWSVEKCVKLFTDVLDATCDAQWPAGAANWQLASARAPCDSTFVSFNFGG